MDVFCVYLSDVADITGAPEMLGGRVKTLHPAVHGGKEYLGHQISSATSLLSQKLLDIQF